MEPQMAADGRRWPQYFKSNGNCSRIGFNKEPWELHFARSVPHAERRLRHLRSSAVNQAVAVFAAFCGHLRFHTLVAPGIKGRKPDASPYTPRPSPYFANRLARRRTAT
jgi:hypothetical protein